ncbi:hypothetical protein DFJ77DRAFT_481101 [Powellomyces hirtus]|nr:hypothetical protein DFJ77DRAFT_481713 [Powellomyces hirtus]KAI8904215.1 hypothetical protein DFJ77DRAFT_481101 [Powellomyces hirtus]
MQNRRLLVFTHISKMSDTASDSDSDFDDDLPQLPPSFFTIEEFEKHVRSGAFEESEDGTALLKLLISNERIDKDLLYATTAPAILKNSLTACRMLARKLHESQDGTRRRLRRWVGKMSNVEENFFAFHSIWKRRRVVGEAIAVKEVQKEYSGNSQSKDHSTSGLTGNGNSHPQTKATAKDAKGKQNLLSQVMNQKRDSSHLPPCHPTPKKRMAGSS